ncbi:DUF2807 domain-containing protein [Fulvivirga sp. 29W222]|uniref:DUF2807 domain-containing protein n=1 Tax=Fulvivirga marina TaxID=2494733 RepID=A0A937FTA8_9BACT|nr:head GIN domain-containing protein [Fulvivirga marina]MBL6445194.1 DUF2807 domain-containing protein [Fulvivirga marina]
MNRLKLILSALLFFSFTLSGVIAQDTEVRNVGSFHEIRTGQAIDVYLKEGAKESVRLEVKGISLEDVLTDVSGGRLKIHLASGRHSHHVVKVYVTYVKLDHISASSASSVFSEGTIKGDRLEVNVSSAADVEVSINMNEVTVSVSSSGDLELKGRAKYLEISASSAGGVDAFDLESENVKVRASSAGGAKVVATKEIDARASSGGSIRYRGNPERSQTDSSSGGSVRKSN